MIDVMAFLTGKIAETTPFGGPHAALGVRLSAQVPLADVSGAIAAPIEEIGERDFFRRQTLAIAHDSGLARIASGQQSGARRSAERRRSERVFKKQTLTRESIKVRRLHAGVAVASRPGRTQLVGKNEKHVGLRMVWHFHFYSGFIWQSLDFSK